MKRTLILLLVSLFAVAGYGQGDSTKAKKAPKLKVSGYIQTQVEISGKDGKTKLGKSTSFNEDMDEGDSFTRFGIRRGRIKFDYSAPIGKAVFQLDITEKGVGFKDAYYQVDEHRFDMFSLKAGIFDRPFGDEISYSSSKRESPERTQLFQNLFPDERDLGAMLIIKAPKNTALNGLKLEAGLFSGNGIKQADDSKLDFIGHLKYDKTVGDVTFGIGASMYYGTTNNTDTLLYRVEDRLWVAEKVEANSLNTRAYYGIDAQLTFHTLIGRTNIRGEYLFGEQPSLVNSFKSPVGNSYTDAFNHIRPFNGFHVYLVQGVWKLPLSAVVKYSSYDANTELSGNDISLATDLASSSLGFGLLWDICSSLRLHAYYEINNNETTTLLSKYSKDLDDNLFTLRLQYKF